MIRPTGAGDKSVPRAVGPFCGHVVPDATVAPAYTIAVYSLDHEGEHLDGQEIGAFDDLGVAYGMAATWHNRPDWMPRHDVPDARRIVVHNATGAEVWAAEIAREEVAGAGA